MNTIKLKMILLITIFLMCNYSIMGQCADTSNIYSFVLDGNIYEVIRENMTWVDAAACAVERGGILAEINDTSEQNAIFTELSSNADINVNNTIAPDGGGGSYVWIGGNDFSVEGNWVWDGDNDNNGTHFWMGTSTGTPIGGLYNNWGNEPDDFQGQDALALSLNGWPLGVAGQWNDVDHTNTLYFVVEHSAVLDIEDIGIGNKIFIYPNPVVDLLTIQADRIDLHSITILNSYGQELKTIPVENNLASKTIDVSNLNNGIYFIKINSQDGESTIKKIINSTLRS